MSGKNNLGGLRDGGESALADAPPIGRERPMARMVDNLKLTLGGASRTCLVTGDAGIGKTRLLQEFLGRVQVYECHVLSGRAQDYDRGIAYATLRDLIGSVNWADLEEANRTDGKELVAALDGEALGRSGRWREGGATYSPYLLTTRFLQGLCAGRPTIVALDDAYLADEETLTALALAARHLTAMPLLLAITVRRDKWEPGSGFAATIGRLIDAGMGTVVDLAPLDVEDTTALIASVLAGRPDERLASYVFAQSRGNPLFAREVLRSLVERRAIQVEHQKLYLVEQPAPTAATSRAALLHRVFQQDEDGRQLARALSAFRRIRVDHLATLEAVTGMDQARIERAFDALIRASIINQVGADWYEFSHPLMAEVLYEDLGPMERRRLHGLIADALDPQRLSGGIDILEWTTHVAEAARPGDRQAIDAVLAAAAQTRNSAPLSAATWYGRALDLLPADAPERPELMTRQAIALWKGSRPEAAVTIGAAALETLGPGRQRTRALATVVNALYAMGRYQAALDQLTAEVDQTDNPAPLLAQQALLLAHFGRVSEARQQQGRAESAAEYGGVEDQAVTYSYLGHVANCLGDFTRVRGAVDHLVAVGSGGEPGLALGARISAFESAAYLLAITDCLTEARQTMGRVVELLPGAGGQDVGGQNVYTRAKIEYLAGSWEDALETIRRGAVHLEFAALDNNLAWLRLLEAHILIEQARLNEAAALLEKPQLPEECVHYSWIREAHRAHLALALGDADAAATLLQPLLPRVRETALVEPYRLCLELLVGLCLATGQAGEAGDYVEELAALAERTRIPTVVVAADLSRAAVLGPSRATAELAERAEDEGQLFVAARAHLLIGSQSRRPSEVERHLGRALALFSNMGALRWIQQVSAEARRHGVMLNHPKRSGRRRSAGPQTVLTPTELKLVQLVRQGLTNRQMSSVLHYSTKTVEVYLSRLYQKVGCRSRLELVLAAERGELEGVLAKDP